MKYTLNTPLDNSDPGFTLPGKKLRWLSGKVAENSPARPWVILRKDKLEKGLIEHIEKYNPSAFSHGDTIRRGELVLAYADVAAVEFHAKNLKERALDQERSIRVAPDARDFSGKQRLKIEVSDESDVTDRMVQQFKTQK